MGNSQEPQDFNISVMPSSLTPVHVAKAAEGLNLYDTASHQVSHFVPLKPGEVGIYVCGATVQSSPHIGHIRAAVAFDIVRRWFLKLGYKVTFVRNVTDIDDKILVKAAGQRWWARAYYYEREFTEAYNTLGVLPPTVEPRATGHMSDMIDLIQRILDNGHGYVVTDADGKPTGNVYFDVASWPHYGELTHQKQTSEVDEAAAVADRMGPSMDATGADKYNPVDPADASPDKHDPRDFALWKAPKDTDPEDARWSTPFGVGRPGWHIECSGISLKYLGEDLDIHCGGIDNAFPHHTNEIAQSESYIGHHWCNYWMHVMHLNTTSGKMSKSKGEFLTVSLLEQKGYDPLAYRLFCLQSHYRKNLVFTWENLDNAMGTYQKLIAKIAALKPSNDPIDDQAVAALREKFNQALGNDLNTSLGITALYDVLKYQTNDATKQYLLDDFDKVLSLDLLKKADEARKKAASAKQSGGDYNIISETGEQDADVEAKIRARYEAKKAKNFAEADRIRDELKAAGVELTDIPGGAKWNRA